MSKQRGEQAGGHGEPEPGGSRLPQPLVTRLTPIELQVGEHVIHALRQPGTVAVLTTVMPGADGARHIMSVGLDHTLMQQVQEFIEHSARDEPAIPCVGFHCYLPAKGGKKP